VVLLESRPKAQRPTARPSSSRERRTVFCSAESTGSTILAFGRKFSSLLGNGRRHRFNSGGERAMAEEKKMLTIIVEGTPHEWPRGEITYAEVVTLEVPDYAQHTDITYSVKYKSGHGNKPEGV